MTSPDPIAEAGRVLEAIAEMQAAGKTDAARALRVELTREDPVLFALVYLRRHLVDPATGRVTLSDVHLAWAETAKTWTSPQREPFADPSPFPTPDWDRVATYPCHYPCHPQSAPLILFARDG